MNGENDTEDLLDDPETEVSALDDAGLDEPEKASVPRIKARRRRRKRTADDAVSPGTLARILDVNPNTVRKWCEGDDGLPAETIGEGRTKRYWISLKAAGAWLVEEGVLTQADGDRLAAGGTHEHE